MSNLMRRDSDPDLCPVTGKVRHRHRAAARRAVTIQTGHLGVKHRKERRPVFVLYVCRHCMGWHVGNKRERYA